MSQRSIYGAKTQIKINSINDSLSSDLKIPLPQLHIRKKSKSYIQNNKNELSAPSLNQLPGCIHTPKHISQNMASLKQFLTSDARSPAIKLLKGSIRQTPNQQKKQKGLNFSEQIEIIQETNNVNGSKRNSQRTQVKRISSKLQSIVENPYQLKYEDHTSENIAKAKEFVTQFDDKLQALKLRNWEKFKFFNKEKILKFIHNKKSKHQLKYNQKMLDSQKPSPIVQKGTISIMLNDHKNHESFDLSKLSSHIPTKSKFKMK